MKHIVVCATVPVVFPKLPLSETTLSVLEDLPFVKGALQKTGLAAGIVDKCALVLPLCCGSPRFYSGPSSSFTHSRQVHDDRRGVSPIQAHLLQIAPAASLQAVA